MGYTIKQKIEICLKSENNPTMTQSDLAKWAQIEYASDKQPSQTTISRILSNKNDLIASKEADFQLVRRRKKLNPILRQILTEWVTQSVWENIPITTPIIQSTANSIWTRLPLDVKDGNGIFNQKWCNQFMKKLNINLSGNESDIKDNLGYKLNKIWHLDDKVELKQYLSGIIQKEGYKPQDIFTIDEFQLFYSLPLDQIFDINSIDKGLKQSSSSTENSLTVMLGTNVDGSEKLTPLIVGKHDKFDVSQSSFQSLKNYHHHNDHLMNKVTETYRIFYKSNINKWITSTMFQNYLLTLDHKLSNKNESQPRKIIIILDDSSSHRILNLKFSNIRLVYLKNNTNHKSPFNSLHNGVNFDYLPMNFGIVQEFKILYRIQQYLEMINIQRNIKTNPEKITLNNLQINNSSTDVLSESDYNVPLVKAIEWIRRSWDAIGCEKILASWKRTHLINIPQIWPNNPILMMINNLNNIDCESNYKKLSQVIGFLNVVLPWQIDEILGLVNERIKATLNYISIEEIVTSCLSESQMDNDNWNHLNNMISPLDNFFNLNLNQINDNFNDFNDLQVPLPVPELQHQHQEQPQHHQAHQAQQSQQQPHQQQHIDQMLPQIQDNHVQNQVINQIPNSLLAPNQTQNQNQAQIQVPTTQDSVESMSISALLAAADEMKDDNISHLSTIPELPQSQALKRKLSSISDEPSKRCSTSSINDSLPSSTTPSPYNATTPLLNQKLYSGITYKASSFSVSNNLSDKKLTKYLTTILEAASLEQLQLSNSTINELKNNLKSIKHRYDQ